MVIYIILKEVDLFNLQEELIGKVKNIREEEKEEEEVIVVVVEKAE